MYKNVLCRVCSKCFKINFLLKAWYVMPYYSPYAIYLEETFTMAICDNN